MTRELVLVIRCNICGQNTEETAVSTAQLVINDGKPRVFDLCPKCVTTFRELWDAGDDPSANGGAKPRARRVATDAPANRTSFAKEERTKELAPVRSWLQGKGDTFTGRIPDAVIREYNRVHNANVRTAKEFKAAMS